jgi:hypothetical protein
MSTVCQRNKEKKRNTHLRVKEAFWNIASLLFSLYFPPLPSIRRLNPAGGFGAWRVNLAFSPHVKVARFRHRAGGMSWVALWRAFPQTQELVFWWFLLSYLTSAPFSCWYFLLIKQRIFWYYSSHQVMAILCCVAKKAASAAHICFWASWIRILIHLSEPDPHSDPYGTKMSRIRNRNTG